jgi:predicted O-methyltransferase YrrM
MLTLPPAIAAEIDKLDRLGKTRTDALQVPHIEGELLAAIAVAHGAKLIVEVGTSYGYSGLWWAAALAVTDGRLHTVDASEKKVAAARDTFRAAGVAERVTVHHGDARHVLPTLPDGIDLVFLDADRPSEIGYFDLLWPKIRRGGGVLTDNVSTHPEQLVDYLRHVRGQPDAHTVELPVGNGLAWTLKLR